MHRLICLTLCRLRRYLYAEAARSDIEYSDRVVERNRCYGHASAKWVNSRFHQQGLYTTIGDGNSCGGSLRPGFRPFFVVRLNVLRVVIRPDSLCAAYIRWGRISLA